MRFRAAADAVARARALRAVGVARARAIRRTSFEEVHVAAGSASAAVGALRRDPAVAEAQLNYIRSTATEPSDPLYRKGRQEYLKVLGMPAVWEGGSATSAEVLAILDTGVDRDHPDLADALLPGYDFIDDDASPDDDEGHGTAVASIAAARASNGEGMAGVSGGARVLPVKVLDSEGEGDDATIATGITWAADRGAQVINLSLEGAGASPVLTEAVAYARSRGAVVVAAAGNDQTSEPSYPAATAGVLAVAATDWAGDFAWFSNYGDWIDLAAPGVVTLGADIAPDGAGWYSSGSGTSFAAPQVAAVALLIRARDPSLSPAAIEARLTSSARDAGPSGRDPYYGAGLIAPPTAVGGAAPPPLLSPVGDGNDTPARASPAAVQGFTRGSISRQGDVDWYSLEISNPGEYILRVVPDADRLDVRPEQLDAELTTYNAGLQPIDHIDTPVTGGVDDGRAVFPTAGRYYVRLANYPGSRGGGYQFSAFRNYSGGEERFLPAELTRLGFGPASAAIADVTGDGLGDALVTTADGTDEAADKLVLYPSSPEGGYSTPREFATGAHPFWDSAGGATSSFTMDISTGDVDGDRRTDAAVAVGRWIAVFRQRDDTLAPAEPVPNSNGADHVEVVDVDGDGRNDLLAAGGSGDVDGISVYRNSGSGFARQHVAPNANYDDIACGDVDGDGRLDFVAVTEGVVDVFRQQPDGSFVAERTSATTEGSVALGDVTGDGVADVVHSAPLAASGDNSTIVVRAGRRGSSPATAVTYPAYRGMKAIEVADYNGDGRNDVVMAHEWASRVELRAQQPDGTLAPPEAAGLDHPSSFLNTSIGVGDMTGDGSLDVVVADSSWTGLWTLRQRTDSTPLPVWIADTTPFEQQRGVARDVRPTVRFGRPLKATSVSSATVRLESAAGAAVPASVAYDTTTKTLTVNPSTQLASSTSYVLRLDGIVDWRGNRLNGSALRFTVTGALSDTTPPDTKIRWAPTGTTREREPWVDAYSSEPGGHLQCSLDGAAFADCVLPKRLPGVLDGNHTFRVRAVDAAGNVDPTPAARTWTLAYATVSRPANDAFHSPQVISGTSGAVTGSNVGAEYDSLRDGLYLTGVNRGGRSIWYSWTPPEDGYATVTTAGSSFDTLLGVFTGTRGTDGTIRRHAENDDAEGVLTSRVRLYVRAGTDYRIGVDGFGDEVDALTGNVALSWTLEAGQDTSPPETTISDGPAPLVPTMPRAFVFSSSEPGSTFECRVEGSISWSPCSSPYRLWLGASGEHVVSIRATDPAGNTDPTPATWRFTSDTSEPETRFTAAAVSPTTDPVYEFASSKPESTFECSLDRAAWAACTSPARYDVGPGSYELRVRAVDRWGRVDSSPSFAYFIVPSAPPSDQSPPETQLTGGPSGTTTATSATFQFSSEPDARFECSVDESPWGQCWSPKSYSALSYGSHTFAVRAVDAAGNRDPTPAQRGWTIVDPAVDTQPPETTLTAGPAGLTSARDATFAFTASEAGATFECRVDGGAWGGCASPHSLAALADGSHAFDVRAVDAAANADPTPATATWRVDTEAPVTAITSGPSGLTADTTPTFDFSAGGDVARYECALDGDPFVVCSPPYTSTVLPAGPHVFAVRATDRAGNVEAEPARRSFEVEGQPAASDPGTPLLAPPQSVTAPAGEAPDVLDEPLALSDVRIGPRRIRAPVRKLTLRFTLSERAVATIRIQRAVPGFRRAGSCRPLGDRRLGTRKPCTAFVRMRGSFGYRGAAGPNVVTFGPSPRRLRLARGRYRMVIVAVTAAGESSRRRSSVFVVRASRATASRGG